jgi:hypothetical protein
MTWITPTTLYLYLRPKLEAGNAYRVTHKQICKDIFQEPVTTDDQISEIKRVWPAAEKLLRRKAGICAMGVTEYYFRKFRKTGAEPTDPIAIKRCLAINWNKGYGIRLLTLKGAHNDPMAIMWLQLRMLNVQGGQAAILHRIAIEYAKGNLTRSLARRLAGIAMEPALPDDDGEFRQLME